jgi:hypothetical protein
VGAGAGALCWRRTTRSETIVTVAARSCPAFAAAWTSMMPSPLPDADVNVIHAASAVADHWQAGCVRTSIPARPPDGANIADGAEIV